MAQILIINPLESRDCGKDTCLTVGLVIVTTHTSAHIRARSQEPASFSKASLGPTCQLVTSCISPISHSQPSQRSKHFSKLKLRNLMKLKFCPYFVEKDFHVKSIKGIFDVRLMPLLTEFSVQLMTREDTLKEKNSGASCDKVRTITKNCKDKVEKNEGMSQLCSGCQARTQR